MAGLTGEEMAEQLRVLGEILDGMAVELGKIVAAMREAHRSYETALRRWSAPGTGGTASAADRAGTPPGDCPMHCPPSLCRVGGGYGCAVARARAVPAPPHDFRPPPAGGYLCFAPRPDGSPCNVIWSDRTVHNPYKPTAATRDGAPLGPCPFGCNPTCGHCAGLTVHTPAL